MKSLLSLLTYIFFVVLEISLPINAAAQNQNLAKTNAVSNRQDPLPAAVSNGANLWKGFLAPTSLWSAFISCITSLLTVYVVNLYLPRRRKKTLTRKLSIEVDPPHNGYARIRIKNGGFWTIKDAVIYLTLDNLAETDTLESEFRGKTHIAPGRFVPLKDEQLCWSVRAPTRTPMKVSIFAKEGQPCAPFLVRDDRIIIPSEEGWPDGEKGTIGRVELRRGRYIGTLIVVSDDTDARCFHFEIDPEAKYLCRVESIKTVRNQGQNAVIPD